MSRETYLRANRYLIPSFSNSPITQSVTHGVPVKKKGGFESSAYSRGIGLSDSIMIPTFRIETIHHGFSHFQFVLDTEIDKIRINKNPIGWTQFSIIAKKQ